METLRNEPVTFGGQPYSTPTVVTTGAGGGGFLETILAASLVGGAGFGSWNRGGVVGDIGAATAFAQKAADNSSQLLTSVVKAEGDIKEATAAGLHRVQIENAANFTNLANKMCDTEKD
jgi:hypothetical protein